jgi:hypothetical protein
MTPRPDLHAHFARLDARIPPHARYVDVDDRPHHTETTIYFRLQKGIDIEDTAANGTGASGGDNGHGFILPPVIYGKPPIDISKGKIFGAMTGILAPQIVQRMLQEMILTSSFKLLRPSISRNQSQFV